MSTYCTRAGIEDVFGVENVKVWADLDCDADATKIANRITRAIAVASAQIDDSVRGTPHTLPLADASGTTPTTVADMAAQLAGVWLYESRGVHDFNPQTGQIAHRLAYQRSNVAKWLQAVRAGQVKLDAI